MKLFKYIIIFVLAITSFAYLNVENLANSNPTTICPVGTSKFSTSPYCADEGNVYGLFTDALIQSCISKSTGGSNACTIKRNFKVNYSGKEYDVSLQRWNKAFFNWLWNKKTCPNGSVTFNTTICKFGEEYIGQLNTNFVNKCLETNSAQDCLVNRINIDKFNLINSKLTIKLIPTTPVIPANPKNPNTYDVSKLVKTPSKTVKPNSNEYWNVFEGFDYSGNLKQIYNKDNHQFVDNQMILNGKKEVTQNPVYSTTIDDERFYTKTAPYSGSRLVLKDKFQYGHISFKAKFPNSSGTMPAFWLFDEVKDKHFTEVDLFEIPGSEKNNVYSVIHYGKTFKEFKSEHKLKNIPSLTSEFNQYDVYRTPNKIVTLINGELLFEKDITNSALSNGVNGLREPLSLTVNLNIGDKWAGPIDDSKLPAKMVLQDLTVEQYNY
jgi:Glycosyl hydrolases family 16